MILLELTTKEYSQLTQMLGLTNKFFEIENTKEVFEINLAEDDCEYLVTQILHANYIIDEAKVVTGSALFLQILKNFIFSNKKTDRINEELREAEISELSNDGINLKLPAKHILTLINLIIKDKTYTKQTGDCKSYKISLTKSQKLSFDKIISDAEHVNKQQHNILESLQICTDVDELYQVSLTIENFAILKEMIELKAAEQETYDEQEIPSGYYDVKFIYRNEKIKALAYKTKGVFKMLMIGDNHPDEIVVLKLGQQELEIIKKI